MLIGHTTTQAQLAQLQQTGRFPHALLMVGPQGIGKRTLAEALATRLICGPQEEDQGGMFGPAEPASPLAPNTHAPAYAQLAAGSCPDYHLLTIPPKKQSIGVDAVRELLATLARTAETTRVILIDAIDDLTPEAANMLLKTLEEPRPGTCFLLVCHQMASVLPTIRSRCRLLPMHPLSESETAQVLQSQGADPALAHLAPGCPGQALNPEAHKIAEAEAKLQTWKEEGGPKPAIAPGQGGSMVQAVLHTLAQSGSFEHAKAYQTLHRQYQKAQTYNIPLNLLADTAQDTL